MSRGREKLLLRANSDVIFLNVLPSADLPLLPNLPKSSVLKLYKIPGTSDPCMSYWSSLIITKFNLQSPLDHVVSVQKCSLVICAVY